MWSGGSGNQYPPYGSVYPTVPAGQSPDPGGVPVLRHHGDPNPAQGQGHGYPQQAPPVPYGSPFQPPSYPPPAGFVQQTQPFAYQPSATGEDDWINVNHLAAFPIGPRLVQALDRQLYNNDNTAKECYVALCTINGEPVFGRAWNNRGKVEAWFPYGDKEHHSGSVPSFQLLAYHGPPVQNFRYAWVQTQHLNPMCQPVRKQDYSPAVLTGIRADSFDGELLGKCNLSRKMAWISYNGKEHPYAGRDFDGAYVLCRVPL